MTEIFMSVIGFIKNQLLFNVFGDLTLGIDLAANIGSYLTAFLDFLEKVNFIIPLPDIFKCMGVVIAIKLGKTILFIVNWVIRRILDAIP